MTPRTLFAAALLFAPVLAAEPPIARHVVQAVADHDTPRILVRWNQLEGATRYRHFDVTRRAATEAAAVTLNADPIGPMSALVDVEALFDRPANADAKQEILAVFGADYASDLLALRTPEPESEMELQARVLPDRNYGAAIALGLGYLDADVVAGTTYVYEVWGLDAKGYRVERLGRATAQAGAISRLLAPLATRCVEPRDETGHLAAFLRWDDAAGETGYRAGYDVLRAKRPANGSCPTVAPGLPGVVRASGHATLGESPGRVRAGRALYQARCASCHAGRDTAPVAGSTIESFTRRLHPELWANPSDAAHDVPQLRPVEFDEIEAIYDYVNEFKFRDEGQDTPAELPKAGETYCYVPFARDLLGQYGNAAPTTACTIPDRVPPEPPSRLRAARVPIAGGETCEISWEGTDAEGEEYRLYRMPDVPRRGFEADAATLVATVDPGGATGTFRATDAGLTASDATQSFFYAARALDRAGNASPFSSWVPCVPRDVVPPPDPTLSVGCGVDPKTGEACPRCDDFRGDARWASLGGDPGFVAMDAGRCAAAITPGGGGDTFRWRVWRSFDDGTYLPGEEVAGPFTMDWDPLTDTPMYVKLQAFDRSGNASGFSIPSLIFFTWKPLPAPRITSVADLGGGRIKIKFVASRPTAVLGFALYRQYEGGDGEPEGAPDLVVRFAEENLGDLYAPGQWAVKSGAARLSKRDAVYERTGDPPGQDEFLYWNPLEQQWVLAAQVVDVDGLILRLHAVSLAGKESSVLPYRWDGYRPGDGRLDWPRFRTENHILQNAAAGLSATWNAISKRVVLDWTAFPGGCNDHRIRPFVVYRQRAGGRWHQISPAFRCDGSDTAMRYSDTDVRPGFTYTYRVVRQDERGEFQMRFGPATIAIP